MVDAQDGRDFCSYAVDTFALGGQLGLLLGFLTGLFGLDRIVKARFVRLDLGLDFFLAAVQELADLQNGSLAFFSRLLAGDADLAELCTMLHGHGHASGRRHVELCGCGQRLRISQSLGEWFKYKLDVLGRLDSDKLLWRLRFNNCDLSLFAHVELLDVY
ncbi:hypothetical protein WK91_18495 [Burkholderia cepacia]|nr:hypothetical protein WK91_18495 [Burkholderia cepacia]